MSSLEADYQRAIQGVTHIWNNEFDLAEKLFEPTKDKNCRSALHYAEAIFIRSFITGDTNDQQTTMERLKFAKDLAEQQLKALERDPRSKSNQSSKDEKVSKEHANQLLNTRIVYGDCLYMTAIMQMTQNEKLKGAFNLRRSWKVFEKALKLSKDVKGLDDELMKCLQFGAGFFLFAVSILPKNRLKLIEMIGFKADRDKGLAFQRETHKSGGIRAAYATMVLLFNNLLLPRGLADVTEYTKEANELVKQSLERYPKGSLFYVMGSHAARKQCDVDTGIKYMELALENCKGLKSQPLIYKYELGNCYCMKMDWKKASEMFAPLIEEQKFQVRIICAIQLACCYVMLNEYDKANELFKRLQTFSSKKKSQFEIIFRQAQRYLANGGHFAAFELLYLRRDLAKMNPIMSQVLAALDEKAKKTKALEKKDLSSTPKANTSKLGKIGMLSPFSKKKEVADHSLDDRASYLLLKGSMLKAIDKSQEAMDCFQEIINMEEYLNEKLYIPYACYELGESYYIKGDLKNAEEFMKKCSKYSGYDWEDPLRVRLRVTMDQLKNGTLPAKEIKVSLDSIEITDNDKDDEDDKEPEPSEDEE